MTRRLWLWLLALPVMCQRYQAPKPKDRMPAWFRQYLEHLPQSRKDELGDYFFGGIDMDDIYQIVGRGKK